MKTTRTFITLLLASFLGFVLTAPTQAQGLDPLNANVIGTIYATAVQPDGKIILSGAFSSVLGVPRSNIARLNADGTLDPDFDPNANSQVECVAVQADGRVLIGGIFTTLQPNGAASPTPRNHIARLNTDGTLDSGFDPNANQSVGSLAIQTDGKVVIGGYFNTLQPNGAASPTPRNHIARLNTDGTLDSGFDPNVVDPEFGSSIVYCVVVQPDGKVLLSGGFTALQPNGAASPTTRNYIARVHADGSLDTGFDPNANDAIMCMAMQADGKVLLGGFEFTALQPNGAASPTTRNRIARLNVDGTLDSTFDPNADSSVLSIAVQADGKVLIGGAFTFFQPNGFPFPLQRNRIARLNADGSLDFNFGPNANNTVLSVALQADGKVLLGGSFTNINGQVRDSFARLRNDDATLRLSAPDPTQVFWQRGGAAPEVSRVTFDLSTNRGANWTSLGVGARVGTTANWRLTGLSLPATGYLRARGATTAGLENSSSGMIEQIASFPLAGELDALDANVGGEFTDAAVLAMAVQPDRKIIIGGFFLTVGGVSCSRIARLNVDGTLDMNFNPNPDGDVYAVAVQADGKVLLGGSFTSLQPNGAASPTTRNNIARVNADGTLDNSFDPNVDNVVNCIAVQADGKVLLGGRFDALQPNGAASPATRNMIARVNADGNLDATFDPGADDPDNPAVYCVAVQPDGKVLLGGEFTTLDGISRRFVARLESNGSLDTGFDPRASKLVNCIAVQPDGKVLLGGEFTSLQPNGAAFPIPRNRIARLNADGSVDLGFNPNASDPSPFEYVVGTSLALQADGKVLFSGAFTTIQPNGGAITKRNRIVRLHADGTLDIGFDPNADRIVFGMTLQADGKVLLGGGFKMLQPNGAAAPTARNWFARLTNDPEVQNLFAPDSTRVLWQRAGTAPELSQATFELSTNGGANWTPPVLATRVGTTPDWQLTGVSLPSSGMLRARGVAAGANFNGSSSLIEQVASFAPFTPLQSWKLANLGDPNAPDTGDGDFDGLIDFVEYALGTSPTLANSLPGTTMFTDANGTYLGIEFDFRGPPSDATIEVQVAGDVSGPWITVGTSVNGAPMTGPGVVPGGAPNHAQVRDTVATSAQPQRLLRLRISH